MKSKFHHSNFFSNPGIFADFLNQYENSWEALPHLSGFIDDFGKIAQSLEYKEIEKGLFVGKNVKIDNSAKIEGRAIIGHLSSIGHAAYLRGNVLIGENVHIGHAVEVKNSIILSGSTLAHLNYIGDSAIGSNVNISGGVIFANLRFDKKDVRVQFGSEKISTNMRKLGSILGDNCFIGVNAVLNPGTVLSKGTIVYPLVSVKGSHLTKEIIQ